MCLINYLESYFEEENIAKLRAEINRPVLLMNLNIKKLFEEDNFVEKLHENLVSSTKEQSVIEWLDFSGLGETQVALEREIAKLIQEFIGRLDTLLIERGIGAGNMMSVFVLIDIGHPISSDFDIRQVSHKIRETLRTRIAQVNVEFLLFLDGERLDGVGKNYLEAITGAQNTNGFSDLCFFFGPYLANGIPASAKKYWDAITKLIVLLNLEAGIDIENIRGRQNNIITGAKLNVLAYGNAKFPTKTSKLFLVVYILDKMIQLHSENNSNFGNDLLAVFSNEKIKNKLSEEVIIKQNKFTLPAVDYISKLKGEEPRSYSALEEALYENQINNYFENIFYKCNSEAFRGYKGEINDFIDSSTGKIAYGYVFAVKAFESSILRLNENKKGLLNEIENLENEIATAYNAQYTFDKRDKILEGIDKFSEKLYGSIYTKKEKLMLNRWSIEIIDDIIRKMNEKIESAEGICESILKTQEEARVLMEGNYFWEKDPYFVECLKNKLVLETNHFLFIEGGRQNFSFELSQWNEDFSKNEYLSSFIKSFKVFFSDNYDCSFGEEVALCNSIIDTLMASLSYSCNMRNNALAETNYENIILTGEERGHLFRKLRERYLNGYGGAFLSINNNDKDNDLLNTEVIKISGNANCSEMMVFLE